MLTSATLRNHWPLLAFGWLMTFGSAFGQTYFISIFGGLIREEFALSHASFGGLYSIGTLASAFVLMWAGQLIDRRSLVNFASCAVIGLAFSTTIMGVAAGPVGLVAAIFCLRFFGQGLMTHAAMTAMARYFTAERGRAISFAALGHVCAQAVLPILTVALMATLHWRTIWIASGGSLLLVLLPLVVFLLARAKPEARPMHQPVARARVETRREGAQLRYVLRDALLYCLLPALMAPAFISTGLIFHQIHIGDERGWSLAVLAFGLSVFAVGSFAMMLVAGVLVDRTSARELIPFSLIPLALACTTLALTEFYIRRVGILRTAWRTVRADVGHSRRRMGRNLRHRAYRLDQGVRHVDDGFLIRLGSGSCWRPDRLAMECHVHCATPGRLHCVRDCIGSDRHPASLNSRKRQFAMLVVARKVRRARFTPSTSRDRGWRRRGSRGRRR